MTTIIYFIRHAEPDFSVKEDALRPLTNKGLIDANKLAIFFKDVVIDKVVTSPFKRAYDTVRPLAISKGIEVELIEEFRERKVSCGPWIDDFTTFAKNQWSDFGYKLAGGDCLSEVQERNILALDKLLSSDKGLNIAVGSHGTALSTIINYYDHSYGYEDFSKIKTLMPWIVKFTFEDKKSPLIESMNL